MGKLTDVINSRVNFESLWQDHRVTADSITQPRLLADKRPSKRSSRLLVDKRNRSNLKPPTRQLVGTIRRPATRKQQIANELGAIFSTCTFGEAREIINSCSDRQEQFLLATFLAQQGWQQTRLGREIAPRLRVGK